MKKTPVLKKDPDMVTRAIDDELLLLPVYKDTDADNAIYSLNAAAASVWKLIDGKRSAEDITLALAKEYNTAQPVIARRLKELLDDLIKIRAVRGTQKGK